MLIAAHFEDSPDKGGEARESRRILRLEAEGLTASGDRARVLVHNISANGLLLESETSLTQHERIDIDLPQAGPTAARVIWASDSFFGCQFDAPISTAALSAAQLRSEAPDEVPDETPDETSTAAVQGPLAGEPFGIRLQRSRKARGLTMSQLASLLGVSKPTIWAWEQGKARPVEGRIAALAEALDVPAGELRLGRSAPMLPDLIGRAKEQIASTLGVAPDKIRIVVDL
ncbi:MAG: helix-turn-helix domain-containing protein [Novosphingobium sp.]